MEILQDMEGLILNCVEIYLEIQDMEIFQGMDIFLDMEIFLDVNFSLDMELFLDFEAQHHTYHIVKRRCKKIIIQLYCQ